MSVVKDKMIVNKLLGFIKKLIGGNNDHFISKRKPKPAYKNQKINLLKVWNNKTYNDFGVERITRLFLVISQFASFGLVVRQIGGKRSTLFRKLAVEVYVLFKLLFTISVLYFHLFQYAFFLIIAIYFLLDTIIYLMCLIFLTDVFTQPISYKRSIITLFLNYIEIGLSYAIIYSFININYPRLYFNKIFSEGYIDGIYFSFVTSATVGYGDLAPINFITKLIAVSQIIVSLIFVTLFFNFFTSKANDPTYYNEKFKKKA